MKGPVLFASVLALLSLLRNSLADSGCEIALSGGQLQNDIKNQLAGGSTSVLDLSASVNGYCGSVGVATLGGKVVGQGIPGAVILSTGSYDSAVSTATGSTIASYTSGFTVSDPVLTSYAAGKTTQDQIVLDVVLKPLTASYVLKLDYVWATDEINSKYDDLAVITIAKCSVADCSSVGSWTLLSSVGGSTVSLVSMRANANLLNKNYVGTDIQTPFNSFSKKLTTVPFTLELGSSYIMKAFVADVGDTSIDTVLYLGALQLSAPAPPPGSGMPPPPSGGAKAKSSSSIVGPVVGGVVGGLLGLLLLILLILFCIRRRRQKQVAIAATPSSPARSLNSIGQMKAGSPITTKGMAIAESRLAASPPSPGSSVVPVPPAGTIRIAEGHVSPANRGSFASTAGAVPDMPADHYQETQSPFAYGGTRVAGNPYQMPATPLKDRVGSPGV